MSGGRARAPRAPGDADAWWAVRVCGRLLCAGGAVVLAAFLWPVGLGGCTALVAVAALAAVAGRRLHTLFAA